MYICIKNELYALVTQTSSSALQQPVGEGDEPVSQGADTLAIIWNTVGTSQSFTCSYVNVWYIHAVTHDHLSGSVCR